MLQKFAPDIGPELMHQVHACIPRQVEAHASYNRLHALSLSRHVEIGDALRQSASNQLGSVEGLMSTVGPSDEHAAGGIDEALQIRRIRITKISGILF